jgi:rhodanese-related sulfurtransferase
MSNPDVLVIDVRPNSMREEIGYFECSTQLVYSQMTPDAFSLSMKELVANDMNHPILVYCATEQSSMSVQQTLLDTGFTNVQSGGAYEDLVEAGCECPATGIFFVS